MTTIDPDSKARQLEDVLHQDIPLTRDMGMQVISWQNHQLRLHLPLAQNINHTSTLFGGSLYCGAVLAGWGWLYLRLKEVGITDGHIVIQEGQISYPLPVKRDGVAICVAPDDAIWDKFVKMYQRRGRARLALNTQIVAEGSEESAVEFVGQYVLHR
ncbi:MULTISPECIES: YiiD C-terminal domain-containing protein [unclassified Pseudomonas]|uniref:YiiD C-terminal domain-containing protein n=1 Tax=unclassified Pseudomonas TaxID=196821 RepID=UPI0025F2E9C9|nr:MULTISPECIES: YiiD C-terminal domain-containing protein [unclassified Pseudomonas]